MIYYKIDFIHKYYKYK